MKKYEWIALACAAYVGLTYRPDLGWWVAPAGSLLILIGVRLAYPATWIELTGLCWTWVVCRRSIALTGVLVLAAWGLIDTITQYRGLLFVSRFAGHLGQDSLYPLFQSFNEEIVLGALLLKGLHRLLAKHHPVLIAVGVALVFASVHYLAYRFLFLGLERVPLTWEAVVCLLGVGVIRNILILSTGHIGYAWALHFAWNFNFFGGSMRYETTGKLLNQAERFNHILGDPIVLALVTVVVIFCFYSSVRV